MTNLPRLSVLLFFCQAFLIVAVFMLMATIRVQRDDITTDGRWGVRHVAALAWILGWILFGLALYVSHFETG